MNTPSDRGDYVVTDIQIGDMVTLRKAHPCGSTTWEVTRVGADIGLKCLGCGRVVLFPRHEFRLRVKEVQGRAGEQGDI